MVKREPGVVRGAMQKIDAIDAQIVTELYAMLRRFAAVTAPWDVEPDDILHGALSRVLQSQSLQALDNPAAYLRRAIANEVNSELRRRRTARRTLRRLRGSRSEANTQEYPSDVADLMRLSPTERAVLFLYEIEGRPFDEVAAMAGITPTNARKIASRARRRLKAEIVLEST